LATSGLEFKINKPNKFFYQGQQIVMESKAEQSSVDIPNFEPDQGTMIKTITDDDITNYILTEEDDFYFVQYYLQLYGRQRTMPQKQTE
jgi:penicillin-binding protein-related factor A (putative recombinase)